MKKKSQSKLFEKILWNTRYVVILSVVFSILASISFFIIGSWDIMTSIIHKNPIINSDISNNNDLLFTVISSIDLFLIGVVLLIFGFGIYELFISHIEIAKEKIGDSTLKIKTLDQLKNKIIKVIIIVLIVKFFEKVLKMSNSFSEPIDILYLGFAILSVSIGFYFINKKN